MKTMSKQLDPHNLTAFAAIESREQVSKRKNSHVSRLIALGSTYDPDKERRLACMANPVLKRGSFF